MNQAHLETSVWIFPIHQYGKKKYIPLTYALPIAYIIPTLFIILLSPLSYNNVLLYQIEFILVAIFYGLTGILTRSKLIGLLNIIPAVLSYLTVEFFVQGIFNFSPPINDPYAGFNAMAAPIASILSNPAFGTVSSLAAFTAYLFLIDILFIFVIAEIGGFFTAVFSTGFWNPKGEFSIIAVIAKIIAVPFVIILIIVLPLFLHGATAALDGTAYIGAGVSELSYAFGMGGTAAQSGGLSLDNLSITSLRQHSLKSSYYFSVANSKFAQLKDNLLVSGLISYIMSTNPSLKGFQNISNALDLIGSVSEVTYVLPDIILGFKALQTGFNETIPILSKAGVTYDPNFKIGLQQLTYAFNNFSLAWQDNTTNQVHGLKKAIQIATSLENVPELANYVNIANFTNALSVSIEALLNMKDSFVQFLNGTYLTTIGLANLGHNDFTNSDKYINAGIKEFKLSNTTLSNIPSPGPVVFELYQDGQGGKGQVQSIPIPIDGVVNIAKDLNSLLIYFAYAGLDSIDLFQGMNNVLNQISTINWTDTAGAANPSYWNGLSSQISVVNVSYVYGLNNLTGATNQANINKGHNYGSLLNPVFQPFSDQLYQQVINLKGNYTDFRDIINGLVNTVYAFRDFSYGSDLFSQWITAYQANGNNTGVPTYPIGNQSLNNFTSSTQYAYQGYLSIQKATGMDPTSRTNWADSLYQTTNSTTDKSVSGADYSGIFILNLPTQNNPTNKAILDIIVQLQMGEILGTG